MIRVLVPLHDSGKLSCVKFLDDLDILWQQHFNKEIPQEGPVDSVKTKNDVLHLMLLPTLLQTLSLKDHIDSGNTRLEI